MSTPKILFAHQNFPGQFGELAKYLGSQNWNVLFATNTPKVSRKKIQKSDDGIRIIGFDRTSDPGQDIHPFLNDIEKATHNAHGFAEMAIKLKQGGYEPDIIMAHSGWGTGSFAKSVWPDAKFVQYLEWWYSFPERDLPQKIKSLAHGVNRRARAQCRNIPFLLDAASADAIIVPTQYQALDVPDFLREKLFIQHDGVDIDFFRPPKRRAEIKLKTATLGADVQVVTYATRGMEPMRGFPEFMESWAQVQHKFPNAHCIIAGTDSVHYADWLPKGESYKQKALEQFDYDLSRLHFVGKLKKPLYRTLLQRSDCHVYLTRPFVLSWSLVDAMAAGCSIVASNNGSVTEALPDNAHALHVDHSDITQLTGAICETLANPDAAQKRGQMVRKRAVEKYDRSKIFPQKLEFLSSLLTR